MSHHASTGSIDLGIRVREHIVRMAAPFLGLRNSVSNWRQGAVVLLYHDLAPHKQRAQSSLTVMEKAFARQLEWLVSRFTIVSTVDLAERLRRQKSVKGLACITFDDGYASTAAVAAPLLRAFSVPATVFVDTGRLGSDPCALSGATIRDCVAAGFHVGSHSVSHADLSSLAPEHVEQEVLRSLDDLRAVIGRTAEGFAYPYGKYDRGVTDIVRRAGFSHAFSSRQHRNSNIGVDLYALPRVEITGLDDHATFVNKVCGAYAPAYAAFYQLSSSRRHWLREC